MEVLDIHLWQKNMRPNFRTDTPTATLQNRSIRQTIRPTEITLRQEFTLREEEQRRVHP